MKRLIVPTALSLCVTALVAAEPDVTESPYEVTSNQAADQLASEMMVGFAAADADGDGKLDLTRTIRILKSLGFGTEQARAAGTARRGRGGRGGRGGSASVEDRFKANDRDGDGELTGDEINAILKQHPESDDNTVTLEEFKHVWEEMFGSAGRRGGAAGRGSGSAGREGGERGDSHAGQGRRGGGGGRYGGLRSTDLEFVAGLDANKDRMIDAKEIVKALQRDLADSARSRSDLDTDGDGRVTAAEYALSMPQSDRARRSDDVLDGHARGHFNREDLDGDGVLSAKDIVDRVAQQALPRVRALALSLKLGAVADHDKDATVTGEEIRAVATKAWRELLAIPESASFDAKTVYPRLRGASPEQTEPLLRSKAEL